MDPSEDQATTEKPETLQAEPNFQNSNLNPIPPQNAQIDINAIYPTPGQNPLNGPEIELKHSIKFISIKIILAVFILLAIFIGGLFWFSNYNNPFSLKSDDKQQPTVVNADQHASLVRYSNNGYSILTPSNYSKIPSRDPDLSIMVPEHKDKTPLDEGDAYEVYMFKTSTITLQFIPGLKTPKENISKLLDSDNFIKSRVIDDPTTGFSINNLKKRQIDGSDGLYGYEISGNITSNMPQQNVEVGMYKYQYLVGRDGGYFIDIFIINNDLELAKNLDNIFSSFLQKQTSN